MAITDQAHQIIAEHFSKKKMHFAVDATCGNGHDMVFLLEHGFQEVLAFDIQQCALDVSKKKLTDRNLSGGKLILDGHENMSSYIEKPVDCCMFNFGYLPTADKSLTTKEHTSLSAIKASMDALSEQGLITLLCYPGHPAGSTETAAIKDLLISLDNTWQTATHLASAPKPTAPILFTINRRNTDN